MYVLLRYSMSREFYYPLLRSDSLSEIADEIIKRVADGCPEKELSVYREINIEILKTVKFSEE